MRANKKHVQLLPRHPMGTMPGLGWLREAPRPVYAPPIAKLSAEQVARHAALRKCMYFPILPMHPMGPGLPPQAARAAERVKTDPSLFRPPLRRRQPIGERAGERAGSHEGRYESRSNDARTWDDPISVGILLAVLPPVGFMMLWGSPRYSRDAKLAITALMAMFMMLGTAAVCTALIVFR